MNSISFNKLLSTKLKIISIWKSDLKRFSNNLNYTNGIKKKQLINNQPKLNQLVIKLSLKTAKFQLSNNSYKPKYFLNTIKTKKLGTHFNLKFLNSNILLSTESSIHNTKKTEQVSQSIFKRFKEAYKQHGKILIGCHLITCSGWFIGFLLLSKSGFNVTSLFKILENIHVMTNETSVNISKKIENFNLEIFLKNSYFDYVMPDLFIKFLGSSITGENLKNIITAIMLYKIFTPLRYVLTLVVTNFVIKIFKKKGKIPLKPPPGSSIKDLYVEQKSVIRRSLKKQQEKIKSKRSIRI